MNMARADCDQLTDKPLRIGLLTFEYPTYDTMGGVAAYVRELARSLLDLGHCPFVILERPQPTPSSWDGPIPVYGLDDTSPPASALPFPIGRGPSLYAAYQVARLAEELRLDVVEAPDICGLTGLLSLFKPRRLRVVVRLHTCDALVWNFDKRRPQSLRERARVGLWNWRERRAITTADGVTSVSAAGVKATREILGIARNDFHVIPNPVGRLFWETFTEDKGDPILVCMGRLEWRKGQDILVRAMPAILDRHPSASLHLYGEDTLTGPGNQSMFSYLESIMTPGVRERVSYEGYVEHGKVPQIYADAAVCVFASRWEGLPVAVEEAMACGRAVVVSDVGPMKELIRHRETGLLARSEEPGAFAAAIDELLSDRSLRRRLGRAARDHASENFRGPAVARRTVGVYQQVLGQSRGASAPA